MTTESFGFMNFRQLGFRLQPNDRKTEFHVGNRHNTMMKVLHKGSIPTRGTILDLIS